MTYAGNAISALINNDDYASDDLWGGSNWNLYPPIKSGPIRNPYRSLNQRCHFSGSEACLSIAGPVHPAPVLVQP
ncbi:hypothetical protein CEXT_538961 [Caerostris extrusa]|uniref:Uncharacterized protein n=1 Tax=Caerostris extrusa TaxID=172846 RepID=A0AAV4WCM8_CAEEX|nr:hypothetical protein CEXT_538961 [Caerostris extrusa]